MYPEQKFPYQKETYLIIGIAMEVHKTLGKGFLEIVYKDAFEHELKTAKHFYEREKEFAIPYKEIILPRKFFADFLVFVALILNFGEDSLVYKRVIF